MNGNRRMGKNVRNRNIIYLFRLIEDTVCIVAAKEKIILFHSFVYEGSRLK